MDGFGDEFRYGFGNDSAMNCAMDFAKRVAMRSVICGALASGVKLLRRISRFSARIIRQKRRAMGVYHTNFNF